MNATSRSCRGQTIVEYLLVVALFALAITVGPHSPLESFFEAIADRYQRFTETISMP
jgi:Flp pilus assembly pilin Flp